MTHPTATTHSPHPRVRMLRRANGRSTPRLGARRPAGRNGGLRPGGMVCLLARSAAALSSSCIDEATDWLAGIVAELDHGPAGAAS